MYEKYYGLKGKPFCLTPDPKFIFFSSSCKRGMYYLRYGLEKGEGFIVISGEPGTGKSLLIRSLLETIPEDEIIARILVTPNLQGDELIRAILICFDITPGNNKSEQLSLLEKYLLARTQENKQVILAVDEAHNLSPSALEELRMLSNFQLNERALLQIFLLGQPALWETLGTPGMVQFKQRIVAAHTMKPLSESETSQYIIRRLRQVGWNGTPAFTSNAYSLIHRQCEGNPRRINTLCDRILLCGFLEERKVINDQLVIRVINEVTEELMEKQGENLSLRLNEDALAHNQQPSHCPNSTAMVDSIFERLSVQSEKKEKQPDADHTKHDSSVVTPPINMDQTSSRQRILIGSGAIGLLCIGLFFMVPDDTKTPLPANVTLSSQQPLFALKSETDFPPSADKPFHDPTQDSESTVEIASTTPPHIQLSDANSPTIVRSTASKPATDKLVSDAPLDVVILDTASPVKSLNNGDLISPTAKTTPAPSTQKTARAAGIKAVVTPQVSAPLTAGSGQKITAGSEQRIIAGSEQKITADTISPAKSDNVKITKRNKGDLINTRQMDTPPPPTAVITAADGVISKSAITALDKGLGLPAALGSLASEPSSKIKQPPLAPGDPSAALSSSHTTLLPPESNINDVTVDEKKPTDEKAFSRLISQFSSAYEKGDLDKLKGLFSLDASTPESSNRDAIIDAYKKLFNFTETRWMEFSNMQWVQKEDYYVGEGRFKASVQEKGRHRQRNYHGQIEFRLEHRDQNPVITYVAHDYD